MKPVANYKEIATENDYHNTSFNSKKDLIRIITRYLRNEDDSVPTEATLKGLSIPALRAIWTKNRPRDIWDQFYHY
jgi:hypothetical protein